MSKLPKCKRLYFAGEYVVNTRELILTKFLKSFHNCIWNMGRTFECRDHINDPDDDNDGIPDLEDDDDDGDGVTDREVLAKVWNPWEFKLT